MKILQSPNSACISYSFNVECFLPPFPPGPHSHEDSSKVSLPTRTPTLGHPPFLSVAGGIRVPPLCSHGIYVLSVMILEPLYIGILHISVSSSTF